MNLVLIVWGGGGDILSLKHTLTAFITLSFCASGTGACRAGPLAQTLRGCDQGVIVQGSSHPELH